jgi:soluble lytic murein transglycosylase
MGNKIMKNMYSRKYENIVEIYSQKYQVDPNLIFAIIKAESNFNATAVSGKGAKGLMQLMEDTAKDVCKKVDTKIDTNKVGDKLLEADINIELGTKYISILLEKYNNIAIALTAYNAGIGTVDNWIEKGIIQNDGEDIQNIPYKETNNYVRKILRDYKIYQKIYND